MFRGTTPTLYFKINNVDNLEDVIDLDITFKGPKLMHMHKNIDDVTIDYEEKVISLDLTEEETLKFNAPEAFVQIKFKFKDEKICASTICKIPVEDPLNTSLMTKKEQPPMPSI